MKLETFIFVPFFVASYASNKKPRDDVVMIEKRKRMLQSFLNRVVEHPILSYQHLFHRFLEEDRPWVIRNYVVF